MTDCIFCKIVADKLPSRRLIETENVLSFLDIYPSNKGHSLVIPKKHYETLLEMPEKELKDVVAVTQKLSKIIIKAVDAKGFNILQSNNSVAGQIVPHVHFHVIPRFENDGMKLGHRQGPHVETDLEKVHKEIKKHL